MGFLWLEPIFFSWTKNYDPNQMGLVTRSNTIYVILTITQALPSIKYLIDYINEFGVFLDNHGLWHFTWSIYEVWTHHHITLNQIKLFFSRRLTWHFSIVCTYHEVNLRHQMNLVLSFTCYVVVVHLLWCLCDDDIEFLETVQLFYAFFWTILCLYLYKVQMHIKLRACVCKTCKDINTKFLTGDSWHVYLW